MSDITTNWQCSLCGEVAHSRHECNVDALKAVILQQQTKVEELDRKIWEAELSRDLAMTTVNELKHQLAVAAHKLRLADARAETDNLIIKELKDE